MPDFGVVVAVLAEEGVALQLREDAGLWNLPGGAVEAGESLAEAAIREVREETGLEVRLTRLVGVYSRPHWLNGGNHQILFAAIPIGGDLRRYDAGETLDARFFDPAALPDNLLWWHRRLIADAIGGIGGSVARTLNAAWPFPADRREVGAAARQDPALAERLRAAFSTPPARDAERLDVGPSPPPERAARTHRPNASSSTTTTNAIAQSTPSAMKPVSAPRIRRGPSASRS